MKNLLLAAAAAAFTLSFGNPAMAVPPPHNAPAHGTEHYGPGPEPTVHGVMIHPDKPKPAPRHGYKHGPKHAPKHLKHAPKPAPKHAPRPAPRGPKHAPKR